jgi:hypothetical protein
MTNRFDSHFSLEQFAWITIYFRRNATRAPVSTNAVLKSTLKEKTKNKKQKTKKSVFHDTKQQYSKSLRKYIKIYKRIAIAAHLASNIHMRTFKMNLLYH